MYLIQKDLTSILNSQGAKHDNDWMRPPYNGSEVNKITI